MEKKGFTLLELVIVIGILAILGTVAVLILNPAELIKQARDSTRMQDLRTLEVALNQYASSGLPDLNGSYPNSECAAGDGGKVYVDKIPPTQSFANRNGGYVAVPLRGIGGGPAGWLPVDFGSMSGGSPLAVLPVDPTDSGDFVYRYACDQTSAVFELDAKLESAKYTSGVDNAMAEDGGDNPNFYEKGTAPGLSL